MDKNFANAYANNKTIVLSREDADYIIKNAFASWLVVANEFGVSEEQAAQIAADASIAGNNLVVFEVNGEKYTVAYTLTVTAEGGQCDIDGMSVSKISNDTEQSTSSALDALADNVTDQLEIPEELPPEEPAEELPPPAEGEEENLAAETELPPEENPAEGEEELPPPTEGEEELPPPPPVEQLQASVHTVSSDHLLITKELEENVVAAVKELFNEIQSGDLVISAVDMSESVMPEYRSRTLTTDVSSAVDTDLSESVVKFLFGAADEDK